MFNLRNLFLSCSHKSGCCRHALATNEVQLRLENTRRYLMWLPAFAILHIAVAFLWAGNVHMDGLAEACAAIFALSVIHTAVTFFRQAVELKSGETDDKKQEVESKWLSPLYTYGFVLVYFIGIFSLYLVSFNYLGNLWWLVPAGIAFFFMVIRIFLFDFLANAKVMSEPLADRDNLARKLYEVADRAGFPTVEIHVVSESFATADRLVFVAPVRKTARVHFAPSVLEKFSDEELAVFFAHELGHLVPGQFSATGVLMVVFSLLKWFSIGVVLSLMPPVYMTPFIFLTAIGVLSMFIDAFIPVLSGSINRMMEKKADIYALKMTEDPDSFMSAFKGIMDLIPVYDQSCLVARMYATHPSVDTRIEYASRWKEKNMSNVRSSK